MLACCSLAALATGPGDALRLGRTGRIAASLPAAPYQNVTIEMWVRPTSDSISANIAYVGDPSTNGYGLRMHDGYSLGYGGTGTIYLARVSNSATGTGGQLRPNRWNHVALTRGSSEWKLYVNGAFIGRGTTAPRTPGDYFGIGTGFEGDIDEVRIWETERTQAEILQSMGRPLVGNETDLSVYYTFDGETGTVANNHASATSSDTTMDADLYGAAEFVSSTVPFTDNRPPSFELTQFPAHMQFLPRDSAGFGTVAVAGEIFDTGFRSVTLEITRDGDDYFEQTDTLDYDASNHASFAFDTLIRAELHEYTVRLYATSNGDIIERILIAEAADIVAGDVFLIAGQSNSHKTSDELNWQSRFVRSYGVQTTHENMDDYDGADTTWGLANAHGYGGYASGPMLTGPWGVYLQKLIMENHEIPVCIINGGAGGSTIQENLPGSNRRDSTTAYGRMLYRAEHAGLKEAAKALFWYHGESHTITDYAENFADLREAWQTDYTGLEKIYVMQIRPGCVLGLAHGALREYQRTLPDSFDNVVVLASAGIIGHEIDGCHFSLAGYEQMADEIYALVDRDIYGSTDTVGVDSPDILQAYYTSDDHDEIAVVFSGNGSDLEWPSNVTVGGASRSMVDGFYLDGASGQVLSGRASGDTLFLTLRTPSTADEITYIPDLPYYPGTSVVYEGPWIVNERGVGALTFFEQPIGEAPATSSAPAAPRIAHPAGVRIMPNPASSAALIRFDAGMSAQPVEITIVDLKGIVMARRSVAGVNQVELDLSGIPPGVYFCRVGNVNRMFSIVR